MTDHSNRLLPSNEMKTRVGGVSDMTIWRWLRKPELGFPQPVCINGRNYWRESELSEFINNRQLRSKSPVVEVPNPLDTGRAAALENARKKQASETALLAVKVRGAVKAEVDTLFADGHTRTGQALNHFELVSTDDQLLRLRAAMVRA